MNAILREHKPASLAELKEFFIRAKQAEDSAKANRLLIEQQILLHFPTDKLEGSVTDSDAGVTCTYKVSRKVDTPTLQRDWEKLPKNAQAAFKWSADVDTKTFRALADLDPATHSTVCAYITTTPNKASISIKE